MPIGRVAVAPVDEPEPFLGLRRLSPLQARRAPQPRLRGSSRPKTFHATSGSLTHADVERIQSGATVPSPTRSPTIRRGARPDHAWAVRWCDPGASSLRRGMDRDDPAYAGQRDYGPLLLRLYDPIVVAHVSRIVWRTPPDVLRDRFRARIHPQPPRRRAGDGLLPRPIRACPTGARSRSSTRIRTCSTTSEAPESVRHHGGRGGRPQAAARAGAVRLGGAPPRDPLPARARWRAQAARGDERRPGPGARRGSCSGRRCWG